MDGWEWSASDYVSLGDLMLRSNADDYKEESESSAVYRNCQGEESRNVVTRWRTPNNQRPRITGELNSWRNW